MTWLKILEMFHLKYSAEALEDVRELRTYIAIRSTRRTATKYIARLKAFCDELRIAPFRGETRPDIEHKQRTIGFEGRVSIVFEIDRSQRIVNIVSISYAGRYLTKRRNQ